MFFAAQDAPRDGSYTDAFYDVIALSRYTLRKRGAVSEFNDGRPVSADVGLLGINALAAVIDCSVIVVANDQTVTRKVVELILRLLAIAVVESSCSHQLLLRAWLGPAPINYVKKLAANFALAEVFAELDAILLVIA